MNSLSRTALLIAAPTALAIPSSAHATTVTGAGSTFVYPVLSRWASDYKKSSGDEIN